MHDLQDYNPAGMVEAFQFTAVAFGTGNRVYVYVDGSSTATRLVVGLYANAAGDVPGSLLAQATITGPTKGAWNSTTLPSTPVAAGTKYWIAVLGPSGAGTLRFRDVPVGEKAQTSAQSNLSVLPASWTAGTTYADAPMSAYVVQEP